MDKGHRDAGKEVGPAFGGRLENVQDALCDSSRFLLTPGRGPWKWKQGRAFVDVS